MKVNELTKQIANEVGYEVKNGEVIAFLKKEYPKITSHNSTVTDEMIDKAKAHFVKIEKKDSKEIEKTEDAKDIKSKRDISSEIKPEKIFKPDDVIACKSVTPWKVMALGVDKTTMYHWNYYGDVDYLTYRDLQALRRTNYITKPLIIIEDADLCYQWRRELGDTYKYFLEVEFPEEFFDKSDDDFTELLTKAPDVLKEVIKTTAISMIRNENYPTIQKLRLIDDILGTCLKDFV